MFVIDFRNILMYHFIKIRPVCSKRTNGWTDIEAGMRKLIVAFRSCANVPKNGAIEIVLADLSRGMQAV